VKIERHNTSPKARSILPFAFKLSIALALITAFIIVSVVVVGYTLPDAGAMAFQAEHGVYADVYARDMMRGTLVNLTNNNAVIGEFTFSPDGKQMIFTSSFATYSQPQLYLKDVKCSGLFEGCGGLYQLTHIAWAGITSVSLSPNGSQIAYLSDHDIHVLTINSGLDYNVTRSPADDFAPAWSPDGSQIAFESQRDSSNPAIYVINRDGSNLQRLTQNDVSYTPPVWSPDGTRIAFTSRDSNGMTDALFVLNIRDGSIHKFTPAPLANVSQSMWSAGGSPMVSDPFWSPDGHQIEFWIGDSLNSSLYAVDLTQIGVWKLITSITGENWVFRLLPNGHFAFLHAANDMGQPDLYVLEGDQIRPIARHAYPPVWWP